jgi:rod shape-determining protein MreD
MLKIPSKPQWVFWVGTFGSALLCSMFQWGSLPGWELVGVNADWSLIWVVVWSLKRPILQATAAGLLMGLVQDGMVATLQSGAFPTHSLGLALVGFLTSLLYQQRLLREDVFILVLLTFTMTVLNETTIALQQTVLSPKDLVQVWNHHQDVALAAALVSALWAPLLYWASQRWNRFLEAE